MITKEIAGGVVHKLPNDFRDAIISDSKALALWEDITPLARNEWICWIDSAKKSETRDRRIKVGLLKMRSGMRRPCCWVGCIHRTK
ncbi:MAG: YdeI/OmpD-associated family protein [Patescibacteria group bacterium]